MNSYEIAAWSHFEACFKFKSFENLGELSDKIIRLLSLNMPDGCLIFINGCGVPLTDPRFKRLQRRNEITKTLIEMRGENEI